MSSAEISQKNDDGTISMMTIDPDVNGFEFVMGQQQHHRSLTIRDGKHEYVYSEATAAAARVR